MSENREYFVTTAKGMEELLADELGRLGAQDIQATRAGVKFSGDLESAYRACLWSRIANRVLMPLKTFDAPNPEKLYGGIRSINWSTIMPADCRLAVDFASARSQITHTHFGALKTKDAICDQFKSTQGTRPSIDTEDPDITVNVYVH
jgi:23S rRNA (guanine2445-N2)-methyltransferase / 23S rRNA (guanine2069-N7)-methyltransferase